MYIYPLAQTLPCANMAACCANPQTQYNLPQWLFHKFAQLSCGIYSMCGNEFVLQLSLRIHNKIGF